MHKISTNAIKPDMVLAQDIKHANGRHLIDRGTYLNENHKRILKIWGIYSVTIENDDEDDDDGQLCSEKSDSSNVRAAQEYLLKRFPPDSLNDPFFGELFRICTLRRLENIGGQKTIFKGSSAFPVCGESNILPDEYTNLISSKEQINPETLVDAEPVLTSLPHVLTEIFRVINDPRSSAVHISDVISKDINLSAKLLKIVNSAFYRLPSKIHTISRAVMTIGTIQLSVLAMGVSAVRVFETIPSSIVDMESFWKHSIACGVGARIIASHLNIINPERLFVAGLLHDIGRIVLYTKIPPVARKILSRASKEDVLLSEAETEILGWNHAKLGGMLLKEWGFPVLLEHGVAYHHNPLQSRYPLEASIVCISDIMSNALEMGSSGEHLVPFLPPAVWDKVGLELAALEDIAQLIERQAAEITHLFLKKDERRK